MVRDLEEDFQIVECSDSNRCACRIQTVCVLKGVLDDALSAFLVVLDDVTPDELLKPRRRLNILLSLSDVKRGAAPVWCPVECSRCRSCKNMHFFRFF